MTKGVTPATKPNVPQEGEKIGKSVIPLANFGSLTIVSISLASTRSSEV